MFGIAAGEWHSLISPPQPPRPNVDPLTGGYRRIPVAQQGADLFCDTALIAREVAELLDAPMLSPGTATDAADALAAEAEGDVFFAAIGSVPPLKLVGTLIGQFGLLGTLRFIKDRSGMMQGASVKPLQGTAAVRAMQVFQDNLNEHLASHKFLNGDEVSYADLCVYHPLWLQQRVGGIAFRESLNYLSRWFNDVEAFGHGKRIERNGDEVFAMARENDPRPLPSVASIHAHTGQQVAVSPADYGRDPVRGQLVWADDQRLILARDSSDFGTLHVHFPVKNYEVAPV
jgi:glutathione S-transferase